MKGLMCLSGYQGSDLRYRVLIWLASIKPNNMSKSCTALVLTSFMMSTVGVSIANAETANNSVSQVHSDNDDIRPFYLAKICTQPAQVDLDIAGCDAGYVSKVEALSDGTVVESNFMDEYDGYGWSHSRIKKLNDDVYLFNLVCGNYCGGNILVGRNGKEQNFDYFFDYDTKTECAVEYDYDKKMWVATPFFSENHFDIVQTQGDRESAILPKYDLKFNQTGDVEVYTIFSDDKIDTISNPCQR